MRKFLFFMAAAAAILLPLAAHATKGVDEKLKGVVEKSNLDGTEYEILETVFYKGDLYAIQKYVSGTKIRCIRMNKNESGLLEWDKYGEEDIVGGNLTDATGVQWGEKLLTFHKYEASNWQIHQRCYYLDDKGEVKKQDWHQIRLEGVEDDEHSGNFIKAVVYKGRLYLFYTYDQGKDLNICYYISDDYDMGSMSEDRAIRFTKRGFMTMADGRKPVFDNDRYDTWDVTTWDAVFPGSEPGTFEEKQMLVLARIHEKKLHIYTFDDENRTNEPESGEFCDVWSYQVKEGFPDECYSLKIVQGAVDYNNMTWNASNDNPLSIFFSDRHDGIRMTHYTPHDAWSGEFWDAHPYTGLPECTFGVGVLTENLDSPIVNEPQYRNYIHLIGGRETECMFSSRLRSNYARCTASERKIDFTTLQQYPALSPLRRLISLNMVVEGCPPVTLENDDQINTISTVTGASDISLTYAERNGSSSSYDVDFSIKLGAGFSAKSKLDDVLEWMPSLGYHHKYNHTKSRSTSISQTITEHFKSVSQKDDALFFYTVPTMCLQSLELYHPDDKNVKVSNYPVTYSFFNTLNSISSVQADLSELLAIDATGPLENWDARFGCLELRECSPLGSVDEICYTRPETRSLSATSSYSESISGSHGVTFDSEFLLQLGNLFAVGNALKIKNTISAEWMWTDTETTNIDRSLSVNYYTCDLGREDLSHYDVDMVAVGSYLEGEHLNSFNLSYADIYYPRLMNMTLPDELGGGPAMLDTDKPIILCYRPVLPLRKAVLKAKPLERGSHDIDYTREVDWYSYSNKAEDCHIRITTASLDEKDWLVAGSFDADLRLIAGEATWAVYDKATGITTLDIEVKNGHEIFAGIAHRSAFGEGNQCAGKFNVDITPLTHGVNVNPAEIGVTFTADSDGITFTSSSAGECLVAVYNIDGSMMSRFTLSGEHHVALPSGRAYVLTVETPSKVCHTKVML